jgi:hypothetical protein
MLLARSESKDAVGEQPEVPAITTIASTPAATTFDRKHLIQAPVARAHGPRPLARKDRASSSRLS